MQLKQFIKEKARQTVGKARAIRTEKNCVICEARLIGQQNKYCSYVCSKKATERLDWSKVDLHELLEVQKLPFTTVGKMLDVSDNSVRKWYRKIVPTP